MRLHDQALTRAMYRLQPGERLALGHGWSIVRAATDDGPGAIAERPTKLPLDND
jgi:hypothetical protein